MDTVRQQVLPTEGNEVLTRSKAMRNTACVDSKWPDHGAGDPVDSYIQAGSNRNPAGFSRDLKCSEMYIKLQRTKKRPRQP